MPIVSSTIDNRDFFESQTTSIEFSGSGEEMGNATLQSIGIADTWSLMLWFRQRGDSVSLNNVTALFASVDAGGNNFILVQSRGTDANDPWRIFTRASSGVATIKDYRFNRPTFFPFDAWHQAIITWDGATDTLTVYENGSSIVPSSTPTDTTGTMTDTDRPIVIGNNPAGGAQDYSGFIHSMAFWDVDIGSAVTEIFNGGVASTFNLRKASFKANLQHWWRLGQDTTDIGKDSGIGSPLIDVDENSANITAADIVSESPA